MSKGYTIEQVIAAIDKTGGIMSQIASNLGCQWQTAKKYVNKWESTKKAYQAERDKFIDSCESILMRNIQLARKKQKGAGGKIVESADAKWVLARLGKDRGYTERTEITGADGEPVILRVKGFDKV